MRLTYRLLANRTDLCAVATYQDGLVKYAPVLEIRRTIQETPTDDAAAF